MYEGITVLCIVAGMGLIAASMMFRDKEDSSPGIKSDQAMNPEAYETLTEELNKKILELNEFSNFIFNEMDKKHKELLFLYQMIMEKEKQIKLSAHVPMHDDVSSASAGPVLGQSAVDGSAAIKDGLPKLRESTHANHGKTEELTEERMRDGSLQEPSLTKAILKMSNSGMSPQEIAKALMVGQGEVALILKLYE